MGKPRFLLLFGFALGLGFGCNSALTGSNGGGKPCGGDGDCGSGQYCMGFSQACPADSFSYIVGVGTCHRDCSQGACACSDRADCRPWQECDSGRCLDLPINCPFEPAVCPSGCTMQSASDRACGPVCLCAQCPSADAGTMACNWPASLNDAGPEGCQASRGLISCSGPSGSCACMSDDAKTCPAPATCGIANGYTACQDQCATNEYAVACGGLPQPDAALASQQPPSGCRLGLATPGGVAVYCCPCESP